VSDVMRETVLQPKARAAESIEEQAYRKVTWRLVPFLMLCYVVAYLDRVNVGFAKLQMLGDLSFSETVYGLGAGIFFIGYFLFEVPSNVIMHRVGGRIWIARIMITWGMISGLMLFVKLPWHFYTLRFLLGVAEAGFYPGIILYLTYWYPSARRARITALFMAAIPISGIIGGPLSGWIMDRLHGAGGLRGWQAMFLIEAIPSLIMGVAVLVYLDNGIRKAKWLSEPEKVVLERNIAEGEKGVTAHPSLRAMFADKRIWLMSFIYFCCVMGQYGITFWLPTLIKGAGVKTTLGVGLLTAIPYGVTVAVMILLGRSADRARERRWHLAIPMVFGAAGLIGAALAAGNIALAVACLTVAAAGIISSAPLFWSLPTSFLTGVAAAAGIATINSVGNLAGFVSPYVVGYLKDATHSTVAGSYVLAAVLVVGALTVLTVPKRLVNR
jgi:D-galactonate transporter